MFLRVSNQDVNVTGVKMVKHLLSILALKKQGSVKTLFKTKCKWKQNLWLIKNKYKKQYHALSHLQIMQVLVVSVFLDCFI